MFGNKQLCFKKKKKRKLKDLISLEALPTTHQSPSNITGAKIHHLVVRFMENSKLLINTSAPRMF